MLESVPFLPSLIAFLETSKYFIIFIGSFFEGTAVMMTSGILWHFGKVQFWPMYGALLAGDVLSDLVWYFLGRFGARRFVARWGHFINMTPAVVEKIERRFHHYHLQILVISKLTMGFGLAAAILATAGMLRVSLARYIIINVLCGFVWVFFVAVIGYYFGNLFRFIPADFQIIFAIAMFVAFILVLRYVSKRLEKVEW